MGSLIKTACRFFLFTVIIIVVFGFSRDTFSATVDDLRRSIDQKTQEIKKLEEEAAKYRNGVATSQKLGRTLKEELTRISGLIAQFKKDITVTERRIEKKNFEIQEIAVHIADKEASIQRLRTGLGSLIEAVSRKDSESLAEVLLKNSGLSDFFRELDSTELVQNKIIISLGTLRSFKHDLETSKASAEDKKLELEGLEGSLYDQKKMQEGTRQERTNLLNTTKNQEKQYQELLTDAEKKQQAVLQEIEELENTLRKLVDPNSLPPAHEGFFKKPVDGPMTQGYGETPFTKTSRGRDFYKFHNGVDFAAPYGTPIVAVADGTARAVGDSDRYCRRGAYGKYAVLDHGNNLATMYAHMSLVKIAAGNTVKRGDIIGYIGLTGLTTGAHLHFTVYDGRTLEIRSGPTGVCGPLPYGGSINPLLYL